MLRDFPHTAAPVLAAALGRTVWAVRRRRGTLRRHGTLAVTWPHPQDARRYWTPAEDRYLLDHPELRAADIGRTLGRTLMAVRTRRNVLRHQPAARPVG